MNIGIPGEIMTGEGRVALTPGACATLVDAGHTVYVQLGAGLNSGYSDQEYEVIGAQMVDDAQALYRAAQLIVKVKQPLPSDSQYLRSDHIIFCYLHLAADFQLIDVLCEIGLCAVPFESVRDDKGKLPLLAPMSRVAGRISVIRGASLLFRNRGGRGVLLGGVDGSDSGRVVVLGAGVAGRSAVSVAVALGARVDVLDLKSEKLALLKQRHPEIHTHLSTAELIADLCMQADLVIGAVLLAGRRAPVLLQQKTLQKMNEGSVIVDISIDQGGCIEGIHTTSSEELSYVSHGVIISAVPNMPAAVARTASQSLSTAILPYVQTLAGCDLSKHGCEALKHVDSPRAQALYRAIAINQGNVVDDVLRQEIEKK